MVFYYCEQSVLLIFTINAPHWPKPFILFTVRNYHNDTCLVLWLLYDHHRNKNIAFGRFVSKISVKCAMVESTARNFKSPEIYIKTKKRTAGRTRIEKWGQRNEKNKQVLLRGGHYNLDRWVCIYIYILQDSICLLLFFLALFCFCFCFVFWCCFCYSFSVFAIISSSVVHIWHRVHTPHS